MTPTEQAVEIRDPLSPHLLAHPFLEGGVGSLMAKAASAYQEDYEMTSDEGADHTPTEFEGWLLEDFWNGLLGEESFFGPVRLLISALTDLQARVGELEGALTKIDAIRNSIIGCQAVNWSEHIYPLVAVLGEVGFEGQEYESARENIGTLIDRANASEFVCALALALLTPPLEQE